VQDTTWEGAGTPHLYAAHLHDKGRRKRRHESPGLWKAGKAAGQQRGQSTGGLLLKIGYLEPTGGKGGFDIRKTLHHQRCRN